MEPYGYDTNEYDFNVLVPDEPAVDALLDIIAYVKARAISLRDGSKYLTELTGRPLTYEGLRRIIKRADHPAINTERYKPAAS